MAKWDYIEEVIVPIYIQATYYVPINEKSHYHIAIQGWAREGEHLYFTIILISTNWPHNETPAFYYNEIYIQMSQL